MIKKPPRRSRLRPTLALLRARIAEAEEGATAIEYALIASGIGAAVAATVWSLGSSPRRISTPALAAMF